MNLFPYQRDAVEWLKAKGGRGLLALSPGLGKTLISLTTIKELDAWPLLVIAPVSLLPTWAEEIKKWLGIEAVLIRGAKDKRMKIYAELATHPQPIAVIGYETFRVDVKEVTAIKWASCIADESGKMRSPTAKISKAIRAFQPPVRIALDGTPLSNSLADLWSPVTWIEPKALYGNWWKFRALHAVMNPWIAGKIDGWRDADWIKQTCNKHIMWKKKEDVLLDLPPLTEQDISIEFTPEEKKEYKRIKDELRVKILGEDVPIQNALTLLLRLRQAANMSKLPAMQELIDSLPENEKIIVFTQFESVVQLLRSLPYKHEYITGTVSSEDRELALKRFKEDPSIRCLYMTSAGERGLNIQFCSYMCQYDQAWSYASYEQRTGRIHRNGQTKPTTVWNLIVKGSVDEHMQKILRAKKELADKLSRADIEAMLE